MQSKSEQQVAHLPSQGPLNRKKRPGQQIKSSSHKFSFAAIRQRPPADPCRDFKKQDKRKLVRFTGMINSNYIQNIIIFVRDEARIKASTFGANLPLGGERILNQWCRDESKNGETPLQEDQEL